MGCDFTTALARLLSDRELRRRFTRDRAAAVEELGVSVEDREMVLRLDAEDLEAQARTLLQKRLHEVRRLLPVTFEQLGSAASDLFLSHAAVYWPTGHNRHLTDAVEFGGFLLRNRVHELYLAEYHRARFALTKQRWNLRLIRRYRIHGLRKCALQVLYRARAGRTRQFVLYFGL